jgi:sec-independent protein translocase protein TatA
LLTPIHAAMTGPEAGFLGFLGLGGSWEYIIILVVVLLLFGSRLPKLARSLGSGIVEFRKGLKGRKRRPGSCRRAARKGSISSDSTSSQQPSDATEKQAEHEKHQA